MENATIDPWRLARRQNLLLPCTGVKGTALLVRQWARLPWFLPTHKSTPPQVTHCGMASQRQRASTHEFQSLILSDAIV